jgi:hypothetical protein
MCFLTRAGDTNPLYSPYRRKMILLHTVVVDVSVRDALKTVEGDNREEDVMPHNRGTRRKPRYVGLVSYKDHTKWVGTHPSIAAYRQAEHERLMELREEVDLTEGL